MNRTTFTLLICAALAAPSAVLAEEAPDDAPKDPRAQVTSGFGPQARRVSLAPPPPAVQSRADEFVPLYVTAAGMTGGLLLGGMAGYSIAGGTSACQVSSSPDPFVVPAGVLGCFAGFTSSLILGLTGGLAGAVVGGLTAGAIYHAYQVQLRVTPVAGSGTTGLSLSGSF
ncbi:MAG TPA: hypothetical protein VIG99_02165 [Myxococcaceae bacterium]